MRILVMLILAVTLSLPYAHAEKDGDRIVTQQEELENIKKEVERAEKRLDSLRNAERQTTGQISSFDQKIAANRKVISRLSGQLKEVQQQMGDTERRLEDSKERLERTRRKYLGDIRQFYMKATQRTGKPLYESPDVGVAANRQVMYLAALAAFESGNVADAGEYLTETLAMLDTLTTERKKVQSLRKDKETATALDISQKEQKEKALEKLRRTKLAEGDRVLTLKQAAEEIERVITMLEEERRRAQQERGRPDGPSIFATLKGQLQAPVRGKVAVPFGPATDPVTRLKSFSPGITINAKAGSPVNAVAVGEVAYVGNLRGYGRFVIVNHDNEFYTTYAGLTTPSVATGDFVTSSTQLGLVGEDGQLKFELRQGREPLDPVLWIRLDSF